MLALAWVGPAIIKKVNQKHLPMQIHMAEKAPPIDSIMLLEYEVRNVRPVVTMSELNESLGPDQFGRSNHAHRRAEHFDARRVLKPLIGHGSNPVPGGKDHVEEMLALENFAKPTLVLDLDRITEVLEMIEDGGIIARFTKDVEILGRSPDAGIGAECISAGQQKGQAEVRKFAQRLRVEGFGPFRRCGRRGGGINCIKGLADCSGLALP
jgi:hypothetical protein